MQRRKPLQIDADKHNLLNSGIGVVCFPAPLPALAACGNTHENQLTKVLIIGSTLRGPPTPLSYWPPRKLGGSRSWAKLRNRERLIARPLGQKPRSCEPAEAGSAEQPCNLLVKVDKSGAPCGFPRTPSARAASQARRLALLGKNRVHGSRLRGLRRVGIISTE